MRYLYVRFGLVLFFGLFGLASHVFGSSGTEGASFLDIPVGAGPAALGSAYTALARDAYAPTWNPAGLGFVDSTQGAAQHMSYLESVDYEYLSVVHPLTQGDGSPVRRGVGFSVQYLGTGDIPKYDIDGNNQPVSMGSYSSHFASYNFAYGQTLNEKLALGVTGKWINAAIDGVAANAYGADLGALYQASDRLSLAGSLMNIGSRLTFVNQSDSLPMAFHAGGAYRLNPRLLLTTEGVYEKSGLASYHVGGDWRPIEMISLRLGYKTDTLSNLGPEAGLTAGLGIHAWGQDFDYAWAPYGDLGSAQYFSLLVRFGARAEEKRNLIQYRTIKQPRTVNGKSQDDQEDQQQLMELFSYDESRTAEAGGNSK